MDRMSEIANAEDIVEVIPEPTGPNTLFNDQEQKQRAWMWQEYADPQFDCDVQMRALDAFFRWITSGAVPAKESKLKAVK
jgi:hypothetical protein